MDSNRPVHDVLRVLEGVEQHNDHHTAFCPAHDDRNHQNLHVKEVEETGQVLAYCFVCKDQEKVLQALEERGLPRAALFRKDGKKAKASR